MTTPTRTVLEALPHTYGFLSQEIQTALVRSVDESLADGSGQITAVASALQESGAAKDQRIARQAARDMAGYRVALQRGDQDVLYARACAATASTAPGGYKAEQAPDGTWTIYDVPIFSEHEEKLSDGRVRKFDEGWLKKALVTARTRHAEGYYPPAHVRHHDLRGGSDEGVEAAGKVRFTELRTINLGGKPTLTLHADLVGLPPATYDRIRRGELSYRSVEILDVNTPEIDSLAFLDHEVPFFRYPLLRVQEEQAQPQRVTASASGALAFRAGGRGPAGTDATAVLFAFQQEGSSMTEPKQLTPPAEEPTQKMGMPLPQLVQQMQQLMQQLMAAVQQPQGQQGPPQPNHGGNAQPPSQMGAGPVEVGMTGAYLQAKPRAEEPKVDNSAQYRVEGAFAAMSAELKELRDRVAKQETEARLASAAAKLREEGFTESMVERFRQVAAKDGETAAMSWADGARIHRIQEPPASWAGEVTSGEPDPPEVAHYAQQGPEALDRARGIASSWRKTGSELPLREFLEIEMDPESYLTGAGR